MSDILRALALVLWPIAFAVVSWMATSCFFHWIDSTESVDDSSDKELKDDVAKLKTQMNALTMQSVFRS